jgi:hypothetical protein
MSKNLSRNEVRTLWKSIDRKLKLATTDTEISGKINRSLTPLELLPLEIPEDKLTLLGSLTANDISLRHEMIEMEKLNRIRRYERLRVSMEHPEIDGCVSIYADEATTEDPLGNIIHVQHPDQEVENIVKACFERIGLEDKSWQIIKNFCGYGDEFYEAVISQTGKSVLKIDKLPREIIERVEENNILKGFKIDQNGMNNEQDPFFSYQLNYQTKNEQDEELIFPFRILHFKSQSDKYGVYGQSIIDTVINTIDQLKMMEKSLVVARVTRAPERRVYTVDVGNLAGEKAIKYANAVVANFKNKKRVSFYENNNNQVDMQKDIFGTVEDIVIPKRQGSEGNSITTLEQANNLSDIADLEFLRDKIFPALGIPRQYFYDDTFANSNTNLSSKSVPFAKKIKRVQRCFLGPCYKIAIIELKLKGYSNEVISQLLISMNNPSNIDEREKITLEMEKWGLIASIKTLNTESIFYPDYLIYQDILKLNKDEIALLMKLNILQENGQNPFDIFDIEDRPELAKDLQMSGQGGGEGGMGGPMGGGGGGFDDMGGGGDMGDVGGEGGEDPEIPDEVQDVLGEPPEQEMMDDVKVSHKNYKLIAEEKKNNIMKKIFKFDEAGVLEKKEDIEKKEYMNMVLKTKKVSFAETFINGQLGGLDKIYEEVVIYTEEEEDFYDLI